MSLDFLRRWFNTLVRYFMEKQGEEYVHLLPASRTKNVDADHEDALRLDSLREKQRIAYQKVKAMGKSCLDGYKPPELIVGDRIDVHFKKEGIVPPTEAKRSPRILHVSRVGHKEGTRTAR